MSGRKKTLTRVSSKLDLVQTSEILESCLAYLGKLTHKTHYLFTQKTQAKTLISLKNKVNQGKNLHLDRVGSKIISDFILYYFVELREPFIPNEKVKNFLKINNQTKKEEVKRFIKTLPESNQKLFLATIKFCFKMVTSSKFSLRKISKLFAPLFIDPKNKSVGKSKLKILKKLIDFYPFLCDSQEAFDKEMEELNLYRKNLKKKTKKKTPKKKTKTKKTNRKDKKKDKKKDRRKKKRTKKHSSYSSSHSYSSSSSYSRSRSRSSSYSSSSYTGSSTDLKSSSSSYSSSSSSSYSSSSSSYSGSRSRSSSYSSSTSYSSSSSSSSSYSDPRKSKKPKNSKTNKRRSKKSRKPKKTNKKTTKNKYSSPQTNKKKLRSRRNTHYNGNYQRSHSVLYKKPERRSSLNIKSTHKDRFKETAIRTSSLDKKSTLRRRQSFNNRSSNSKTKTKTKTKPKRSSSLQTEQKQKKITNLITSNSIRSEEATKQEIEEAIEILTKKIEKMNKVCKNRRNEFFQEKKTLNTEFDNKRTLQKELIDKIEQLELQDTSLIRKIKNSKKKKKQLHSSIKETSKYLTEKKSNYIEKEKESNEIEKEMNDKKEQYSKEYDIYEKIIANFERKYDWQKIIYKTN
ncbi:formin homology 2 domain containing isoform i [Anaeramoeba flamelloides]|uniref:Formin homology 2 domain containing isoform i n=1 Tax=Anaeramoeba flamelloides TaxID=1746091 RepID=A0AAV7YWN8_9EUKA|nr:formin homology 2 domain containing isoform i [Anaeramoeba flamelloides]